MPADITLGKRLETVMSSEVTGRGVDPVVDDVQDIEAPAFFINCMCTVTGAQDGVDTKFVLDELPQGLKRMVMVLPLVICTDGVNCIVRMEEAPTTSELLLIEQELIGDAS